MRVKLDKVCKRIYAGGDVPKDRYSTVKTAECAIPIYANAEKDNGLYGYTDTARENELSITVAARGTIGFTAIRREPFLPVVRLITVVPDLSTVSERYLYYALRNCKPASSGTSIPQLTVPDIKKNEIELYSLSVQDKIADKLDAVERIIELRKHQLQKLDELVKSRFVELFGDPKLNDKGWNAGIVSDYYEVKGGKRIPKGMGYADGVTAHPYLRATDMKNETILDDDIHYIDEEVYALIKRYTVKSGDVYLTNVGVNLGMAGVIPEKYDGANLTENAVKLVPKTEKVIDGVFLAHYINSPGIQDYINERKMSVGVPKLAIFRIETMPLLLPPMDIQMQFIEFCKQTDKSKVAVQKALDEAQLLFDSLMQKYFG